MRKLLSNKSKMKNYKTAEIKNQPKIEQKETEPKIDFVEIFKERLKNLPLASEEIKQSLPWELQDVKKIATALVLAFEKISNWDIWIENFTNKNLKSKYDPSLSVHSEAQNILKQFLSRQSNIQKYKYKLEFPICAFIIQNVADKISLLLERDIAETLVNLQLHYQEEIISLYENYNLNEVIGAFDFDYKTRIFGKTKNILNSPNIMDKVRELQYLKNFRRYHPMTNTQYARWLTASKTKEQGQTDEDVAEKITAMDKTEDPTRRPDSEPLAE